MTRLEAVSAWEAEVSRQLPVLSRPQARVLAWWSVGVVLAQRCGQSSVAAALAPVLGHHEASVRQRLREWTYAAADKRGPQRQAVAVERCFAPLLGWVLRAWPAEERRLALALDATTLGQRFTVLALCVLYRGAGIPVAWAVVRANTPGAWRPHWEQLLARMRGAVPADWTVVVLADRGLYAAWLFTAVVRRGWHPLLRLNGAAGSGLYRRSTGGGWRPLASVLTQPGDQWAGAVLCHHVHPIAGTLLARWEAGYREGWLVLTDLPVEQAMVGWYALRVWIECGFKELKRAGWQWQRTRMTDPARAARFWLVLAVATLWVVSAGGMAEASPDGQPVSGLAPVPSPRRPSPRLLSCFRRGLYVVALALLGARSLPTLRFLPEPWPRHVSAKTSP